MRRFRTLAVAAVLAALGLVLATPSPVQANLLKNASVEQGSSATDITDWTRNNGTEFREDETSFGYTPPPPIKDGTYAVKMFGGDSDLSQVVTGLQGDAEYVANGWFYHSSTEDVIANDTASTRMFMHIEWFDVNDVSLRNDYSANHNGTSPADSWNLISMTVTSPTGASYAVFHIESDSNVGGGSVFGDQFSFFVPEPAAMSLLAMGSLLLLGRRKK